MREARPDKPVGTGIVAEILFLRAARKKKIAAPARMTPF